MENETNAGAVAWPIALAAAAVAGSLATACMMPFVAIATLAAATMPRRQALIAVFGAWTANQLLGFGLLGYPMTAYAASWGVALGAAGVAALLVARLITGGGHPTAARVAAAFAVAFASYEALLYAFALVAGGTGTFTASIVLRILANDAAWLVGLAALHAVLTRAAPRTFGPPATQRLV